MSLRDAIKDVIEIIRKDVPHVREAHGYVTMLELALKASAEPAVPFVLPSSQRFGPCLNPSGFRGDVDSPRLGPRGRSGADEPAESVGAQFVEIVGGTMAGDLAPGPPPGTPDGAKTEIAGEVYVYRQGKLHFSAQETVKLHEAKKESR